MRIAVLRVIVGTFLTNRPICYFGSNIALNTINKLNMWRMQCTWPFARPGLDCIPSPKLSAIHSRRLFRQIWISGLISLREITQNVIKKEKSIHYKKCIELSFVDLGYNRRIYAQIKILCALVALHWLCLFLRPFLLHLLSRAFSFSLSLSRSFSLSLFLSILL